MVYILKLSFVEDPADPAINFKYLVTSKMLLGALKIKWQTWLMRENAIMYTQ